MSSYPRLTTALMIAMGSLLGPLLEQAGFWGYCQAMLEQEFPGPAAIVMSSVLFAALPHPPMHSASVAAADLLLSHRSHIRHDGLPNQLNSAGRGGSHPGGLVFFHYGVA